MESRTGSSFEIFSYSGLSTWQCFYLIQYGNNSLRFIIEELASSCRGCKHYEFSLPNDIVDEF